MMLALMFSLYCFIIAAGSTKWLQWIGVISLILCFFLPELSVFLPVFCYIYFYRQQYLLPVLYCMPVVFYCTRSQNTANVLLFALIALGFYFSRQSLVRTQLKQKTKQLRDSSVEREMLLRRSNEQLIERQDSQIYIATLKERNRIAREIHDNVGHLLSSSLLQIGALLAICKDETLKPHLHMAKDTLNEAMNSIRSSVHDLHDESVDLQAALTSLVNQFTLCPVQFHCEISRNIPKEVKYCFLSITKEALNNIIRHSNATKVSLTVKEHPGFYQLLVEDNGTTTSGDTRSDSTDRKPQDGIGLANIEERVNALHGIIHINRENGFRIFVSVPK